MTTILRFVCGFCGALFLLAASQLRAQIPGTLWASGGGSAKASYGQQAQARGVVADAAGNTYVTGIFRDTLTLGNTRLVSVGNYDVYVARLDAAGRYQWAAQAGGSGWDISSGVALDASGNVYLTGYVESTVSRFGGIQLNNPSYGAGLFVAKLSATGTWLQATLAAGPRDTYTISNALAVDATGAVYVTGGLRGEVQFGATTLSAGGYGVFVAKLSAAGTWQWAVLGSEGYDFGQAIALDGAGNPYVTGSFFANPATFGPFTLTNAGYRSSDVFVAKLTAAGTWQWVVRGGGSLDDGGRGIVVDPAGNVYVAGSTAGSAPLFGTVSPAKPDNSLDIFVAKLTATGTWQWVTLGGGPEADVAVGIVLHDTGNLTIAGYLGSPNSKFGSLPPVGTTGKTDAVVAQLNAEGNWRWALGAGGPGTEYPQALAAGPHEEVRVVGTFEGASATFGPVTLAGGTKYYEYYADCQFVANFADLAQRSPANLTLWPNPSRGTVWATGLEAGQPARVFDSMGRLVAADARPAYESQGLQLPTLAPGVYIVRCGTQARRFVIY